MHTISIYPEICLDRIGRETLKDGRPYTEKETRWTMKTSVNRKNGSEGQSYVLQAEYNGMGTTFHYFVYKMGERFDFVRNEVWEENKEYHEQYTDKEFCPPYWNWKMGGSLGFQMHILDEMERKFLAIKELIPLSYCD